MDDEENIGLKVERNQSRHGNKQKLCIKSKK